jgi:hypothetical protein
MKLKPLLVAALLAAGIFGARSPALADTNPPPPITKPAFAQIVHIDGSTMLLRTGDGKIVGVQVTPAALKNARVKVGTIVRLVPLPGGNVRVELPSGNAQAPCDGTQTADSGCMQ